MRALCKCSIVGPKKKKNYSRTRYKRFSVYKLYLLNWRGLTVLWAHSISRDIIEAPGTEIKCNPEQGNLCNDREKKNNQPNLSCSKDKWYSLWRATQAMQTQ